MFIYLAGLLKPVRQFMAPVNNDENAKWYYTFARFTISTLILTIPFAYDFAVPEVAGDMRWYMMHFTGLALICVFLTHCFMQSKKGEKFTLNLKLTPTSWAVAITVFFGFLTMIWGLSLPNNWWFLKNLVGYALVFTFALHLRHEIWYRNLAWLLAIGVAFNAMLGILQFFAVSDVQIANYLPFVDKITFINFFQQSAPPAGAFANKNLAASYMVMCIPLMLYLMLTSKRNFRLILSSIAFTLASIFLIYTRSRGSWISAIAVIVFAIFWLSINKPQRKAVLSQFNMAKIIAILTSLLIIFWASSYNSNLNRTGQTFHSMDKTVSQQFSSIGGISEGELSVRSAYNINGVDIIMDYPFGVGLGGFHTIYPKYFKSSVLTPKTGYNLAARPRRMHNDMFQAFVELGVVGGAAHLFIFLSPLIMAWRLGKNEKTTEKTKVFSFFILLAIGGMCVNSLGDFPLQMPTAPAVLWLLAGIMTGLYALNIKNAHKGWALETPLPNKVVTATLGVIVFAALIFTTYDNYMRREGTKYLKPALGLSRIGQNNDTTLYLINKSHNYYTFNPREREIHGVITMAHDSTKPNSKAVISYEDRIKTLEEALKYDPYAQNTLINIAMLKMREGQRVLNAGDKGLATKLIVSGHEHAKRALELSYYTPNAHAVYAISLLYIGRNLEAYNHFLKSLEIQADFPASLEYVAKLKPLYEAGKLK
mgnify:CR=1 FL=1